MTGYSDGVTLKISQIKTMQFALCLASGTIYGNFNLVIDNEGNDIYKRGNHMILTRYDDKIMGKCKLIHTVLHDDVMIEVSEFTLGFYMPLGSNDLHIHNNIMTLSSMIEHDYIKHIMFKDCGLQHITCCTREDVLAIETSACINNQIGTNIGFYITYCTTAWNYISDGKIGFGG